MAAQRQGAAQLGAIVESDEDEHGGGGAPFGGGYDSCYGEGQDAASSSDVPQAFSHFTWSVSNAEVLICDLQARRYTPVPPPSPADGCSSTARTAIPGITMHAICSPRCTTLPAGGQHGTASEGR